MIQMRVSEAAAVLSAPYRGDDIEFQGVGTDSRCLRRNALFVALPGDKYDGGIFVEHACQRGAAAVLTEHDEVCAVPSIQVPDSRLALGYLAAAWRRRFSIPVVGITGSNGKTTVKEMLAAMLRVEGDVLATHGNFNNEIGLPLTLLQLAKRHRYGVIEMGASRAGDIAYLSNIAKPTVGILTLCAPSHLEGFGSIEQTARAKGELLEALSADGIAVINADDAYADLWRELAGARQILTFGLEQSADVSASWQPSGMGSELEIRTKDGVICQAKLALPGRHNVMNALAASAAALALGASGKSICCGLEAMEPIPGRLYCAQGVNGITLIDDSYNANPNSLNAALEVLVASPGEHWLVLGDMAELGEQTEKLHRQAGIAAKEQGVVRLFSLGTHSKLATGAFGVGAEHYSSEEALLAALQGNLHSRVSLLIKGSRMMGLERVAQALRGEL